MCLIEQLEQIQSFEVKEESQRGSSCGAGVQCRLLIVSSTIARAPGYRRTQPYNLVD